MYTAEGSFEGGGFLDACLVLPFDTFTRHGSVRAVYSPKSAPPLPNADRVNQVHGSWEGGRMQSGKQSVERELDRLTV